MAKAEISCENAWAQLEHHKLTTRGHPAPHKLEYERKAPVPEVAELAGIAPGTSVDQVDSRWLRLVR